jgi:hypothetical protein
VLTGLCQGHRVGTGREIRLAALVAEIAQCQWRRGAGGSSSGTVFVGIVLRSTILVGAHCLCKAISISAILYGTILVRASFLGVVFVGVTFIGNTFVRAIVVIVTLHSAIWYGAAWVSIIINVASIDFRAGLAMRWATEG